MIIPVKTTQERFVGNVLKCLNPLLKLRKREVEVLTAILNTYFEHRSLADEDLYALLFSKDMRAKMRVEIGMGEASFNNHLIQLKAKRLLTPTLRLSPNLLEVFEKNVKNGKLEVTFVVETVVEPTISV